MRTFLPFIRLTFLRPGIITALLIISFSTQAQTSWNLRAGLQLSGVDIINENGDTEDSQRIPRLQIGLGAELPVKEQLYLQAGLFYVGKGFKQEGGWLANSEDEFKARVSYIQLPVALLYKPALGFGNLLIGAGPYIGYGLGGKWEATGQIAVGDIIIESQGDVIFKEDAFDGEFGNYLYGKPWDYGAAVLLGYEFPQRFNIQLNGEWGIANLKPEVQGAEPEGSTRNKAIGLSIGYRF